MKRGFSSHFKMAFWGGKPLLHMTSLVAPCRRVVPHLVKAQNERPRINPLFLKRVNVYGFCQMTQMKLCCFEARHFEGYHHDSQQSWNIRMHQVQENSGRQKVSVKPKRMSGQSEATVATTTHWDIVTLSWGRAQSINHWLYCFMANISVLEDDFLRAGGLGGQLWSPTDRQLTNSGLFLLVVA